MFDWFQVVKVLLDSGAKTSLVNKDGWTSFHVATREGDVDVMRLFVDKDPEAWKTVSNNGSTPLHTACLAGHMVTI